MMNVGFRILGFGWKNYEPFIHCVVTSDNLAYDVQMEFNKLQNKWMHREKILNAEEAGMLDKIWHDIEKGLNL